MNPEAPSPASPSSESSTPRVDTHAAEPAQVAGEAIPTGVPPAIAQPAAVTPPVAPPPAALAIDPMERARQAFSLLDPTGLRPTAIVLGIIAALFFGSQLVNAVIPTPGVAPGTGVGPGAGPVPPVVAPQQPTDPGAGPVPPGSFLTAGPLRIPLVAGWQPATNTNSSAIASLVKGAVQIDLFSATITGGTASPTAVYNTYMSFIGQNATGFGSGRPTGVQIGGGLPAARGVYQGVFDGNQLEGEVTAFLTGTSDGWVWDAWGPPGTLGTLLPEVHSMIDSVQLTGGG